MSDRLENSSFQLCLNYNEKSRINFRNELKCMLYNRNDLTFKKYGNCFHIFRTPPNCLQIVICNFCCSVEKRTEGLMMRFHGLF